MAPPQVIGIAGLARSGKDTVAAYLGSYGYYRDSFAAPIRELVARILNITLEDLERLKETPLAMLGGKTPRYAMQTLGTEWGRNTIDPSLWINSCITRAYVKGNVVISDVRFDNEAEAIRKAGGTILHIERPRRTPVDNSNHPSEGGIQRYDRDWKLINDGTLADLYRGVDALLLG